MNSDTLFYIFMFVCICVHVGYLNTTKIYYDAKNVATSNQCNDRVKNLIDSDTILTAKDTEYKIGIASIANLDLFKYNLAVASVILSFIFLFMAVMQGKTNSKFNIPLIGVLISTLCFLPYIDHNSKVGNSKIESDSVIGIKFDRKLHEVDIAFCSLQIILLVSYFYVLWQN